MNRNRFCDAPFCHGSGGTKGGDVKMSCFPCVQIPSGGGEEATGSTRPRGMKGETGVTGSAGANGKNR